MSYEAYEITSTVYMFLFIMMLCFIYGSDYLTSFSFSSFIAIIYFVTIKFLSS